MVRDLGDLASSLARTPGAIQTGQVTGVRKAALFTTNTIRSEIRSATGDSRLSGVGKKGARVGARYDWAFGSSKAEPSIEVKATGPLHLIERATSSHLILPRSYRFSAKTGRRLRGGARALKFGGRFSAYAEHPGTPAKRPFAKGVARAAPRTVAIFNTEVGNQIMKAWK